jgi:KUP system potassium uptake protein
VTAVFLVPDLAFWTAAMLKIPDGGWFPLAVALGVLALLQTWEQGRSVLRGALADRLLPIESVVDDIARSAIPRAPGTAVYLTSDETGTPIALLHNLKINRIVHERNLFLTIRGEEVPYVAPAERIDIRELSPGFLRVIARYGFMENPDVPELLKAADLQALGIRPQDTYFVLSRNQLLPSSRKTMPRWRRKLFVLLSRNSAAPERFFHLRPNQVLELGMQIEI